MWFLAIAVLLTMFAPAAIAQVHPNDAKYEYTIRDYAGREPLGAERIQWECWDDKAKASLSCTFVHGSLLKFRYVYREKGGRQIDPTNICTMLLLDRGKVTYESEVALEASKGHHHDICEEVTEQRFQVLKSRQIVAVTVRMAVAKCFLASDATDMVERDKDTLKDDEDWLQNRKSRCEQNQEAKQREQEVDQREAEREAQNSLMGSNATDFGSLSSDDKITCFGGCNSVPVSPRGPYSTITSRSWGDRAPPDTFGTVRSAR
jgi:hypothetical protein